MRLGVARLQRRITDLVAFDPRSVQKRWAPEVKELEISIEESLSAAFGQHTVEYNRYRPATRLDNGPIDKTSGLDGQIPRLRQRSEDLKQIYRYLINGKQQSISLLRQAVRRLEEEITDRGDASAAPAPPALEVSKVFVVHGHDGAPKAEVARFIERLGFDAIILHERPNKGRALIAKFAEEAAGVGFAVVLMTPDDQGRAGNAVDLNPRARQNVVFELGFFIGRLGPHRVAALIKGNIELPSDFDGVAYISLDREDWQAKLGAELNAAGFEIDWNKMMRQ
jgi:predicted nucleotide-binding protein